MQLRAENPCWELIEFSHVSLDETLCIEHSRRDTYCCPTCNSFSRLWTEKTEKNGGSQFLEKQLWNMPKVNLFQILFCQSLDIFSFLPFRGFLSTFSNIRVYSCREHKRCLWNNLDITIQSSCAMYDCQYKSLTDIWWIILRIPDMEFSNYGKNLKYNYDFHQDKSLKYSKKFRFIVYI